MNNFDPIHPDIPEFPDTELQLTPNYNLLLMVKDTITSWLNIVNTNMLKIDTAMHDLTLRTSIDGEIPPEAIEDLIRLEANLTSLSSTVEKHDEDIDDIEHQLLNLQTLSTDVSVLKQNYINLDTKMTAFETRLDMLQATVTKLDNNYNALEERVAALEQKGET